MAKVLFISYDGLTDPLGQSQILPYLCGLSNKGYEIFILSCEKQKNYEKNKETIYRICEQYNLKWSYIFFHRKPPILSKYYDLYNLKNKAKQLYKEHNFEIIHCRSYLSAQIGRFLKLQYGTKFLFDMRSFWVDERVEGGLWDKKKLLYRIAYKNWKRKEANFIKDSDYIISLTEAGKREIMRWPAWNGTPISVIPCSADLSLFSMTNDMQQNEAKKSLGIDVSTYVVSYLGSLGTWYLLNEMLKLFSLIKAKYGRAKFLILTPENPQLVFQKAKQYQLSEEDFVVKSVARKDVAKIIKASNISLSFILPVYSKTASSPTKLGELLAMGIPVICNDIGDVRTIIEESNGGIILEDFTTEALNNAINLVKYIHRDNFNYTYIYQYYDLKNAVNTYSIVYSFLTNPPKYD